jgi:hypothetical protein
MISTKGWVDPARIPATGSPAPSMCHAILSRREARSDWDGRETAARRALLSDAATYIRYKYSTTPTGRHRPADVAKLKRDQSMWRNSTRATVTVASPLLVFPSSLSEIIWLLVLSDIAESSSWVPEGATSRPMWRNRSGIRGCGGIPLGPR